MFTVITIYIDLIFNKCYNILEVINMPKPKLVNRVIPNSPVDKELYDWLREYSKETRIPMSRLLDISIEMLKESTKK